MIAFLRPTTPKLIAALVILVTPILADTIAAELGPRLWLASNPQPTLDDVLESQVFERLRASADAYQSLEADFGEPTPLFAVTQYTCQVVSAYLAACLLVALVQRFSRPRASDQALQPTWDSEPSRRGYARRHRDQTALATVGGVPAAQRPIRQAARRDHPLERIRTVVAASLVWFAATGSAIALDVRIPTGVVPDNGPREVADVVLSHPWYYGRVRLHSVHEVLGVEFRLGSHPPSSAVWVALVRGQATFSPPLGAPASSWEYACVYFDEPTLELLQIELVASPEAQEKPGFESCTKT